MGDSGEQGKREQELHSRIPFFLTCEFCRAGGGRDHTTRLRTLTCLNAHYETSSTYMSFRSSLGDAVRPFENLTDDAIRLRSISLLERRMCLICASKC